MAVPAVSAEDLNASQSSPFVVSLNALIAVVFAVLAQLSINSAGATAAASPYAPQGYQQAGYGQQQGYQQQGNAQAYGQPGQQQAWGQPVVVSTRVSSVDLAGVATVFAVALGSSWKRARLNSRRE